MVKSDELINQLLERLGNEFFVEHHEVGLNNADESDVRKIRYDIRKSRRFLGSKKVVEIYSRAYNCEGSDSVDLSEYPSTNTPRLNYELFRRDIESGRKSLELIHFVVKDKRQLPENIKSLLQEKLKEGVDRWY